MQFLAIPLAAIVLVLTIRLLTLIVGVLVWAAKANPAETVSLVGLPVLLGGMVGWFVVNARK